MSSVAHIWLLSAVSVGSLWSQQNSSASIKVPPATAAASIVLSGMVMMEDGSSVPGNVDIRMSCNGSERTVTHMTVNDDFQFQWMRASQTGPLTGVNNFMNTMAGANSDASSAVRVSPVEQSGYCDLRASAPGYRSSDINLNNPSEFDGTSLGVLWLRPLNEHQGNMISVLSLRAPKEASKLFDKGMELLHSGKLPAAAASFQKAVAIYPQYADAWLFLGNVQFRMGVGDLAENALRQAVALDPKLPGAWQTLGYLAFNQKKWDDAAGYLFQAERLDPRNSPTPWFYSAVAYYELRKYDQAEKSIRNEIDLDPQFQNRRARYVLGLILLARHDVSEGSDVLRSYLAASPDPGDVAAAKTVLGSLEKYSGN